MPKSFSVKICHPATLEGNLLTRQTLFASVTISLAFIPIRQTEELRMGSGSSPHDASPERFPSDSLPGCSTCRPRERSLVIRNDLEKAGIGILQARTAAHAKRISHSTGRSSSGSL